MADYDPDSIYRFKVGDCVGFSDSARRVNICRNLTRRGTVIWFSRDRLTPTVYVQWDGRSTAEGFHPRWLQIMERPRR